MKLLSNALIWGIFKRNSYLFFENIRYRLILILLVQCIIIKSLSVANNSWGLLSLLNGVNDLSHFSNFPFLWLFFIFSIFLVIGDSFSELVKKHYPLVSSIPLGLYLLIGLFLISCTALLAPLLWVTLTLGKNLQLSYFCYLIITFVILTIFFSICTLFLETTLVELSLLSLFILSIPIKEFPIFSSLMFCRFTGFSITDLLCLGGIIILSVFLLKRISHIDFV